MKIDLYSKIILTVIAICLVQIVVRDVAFVNEAQAFGHTPDKIDINWPDTIDVNIEEVNGRWLSGGALPVTIR